MQKWEYLVALARTIAGQHVVTVENRKSFLGKTSFTKEEWHELNQKGCENCPELSDYLNVRGGQGWELIVKSDYADHRGHRSIFILKRPLMEIITEPYREAGDTSPVVVPDLD